MGKGGWLAVMVGVSMTLLSACGGADSTSARSHDRSLHTATAASTAALKAAAIASWDAPVLLTTPTSLGAVHLGMDLRQAQAASHARFTSGGGDGIVNNSLGLPLSAHGVFEKVDCVGAGLLKSGKPVILTSEGFRVGQTVAQLQSIYGSRLVYFDDEGGYAPTLGYRLKEPTGLLTFFVTGSQVTGIAGSGSQPPAGTC